MAHLAPTDILKPGFEGRPVKDENGNTLAGHTLEDVEFCLRLLAYNNSSYSRTAKQLETDYGIIVHPITLRRWACQGFTQRYVQIQHELGQEINKKLSAHVTDLAARAAEAEMDAVEKTITKMDDIAPDKLPTAVSALSNAVAKNVETSALLSDRPTQIIKHDNPDTALQFLRQMGLLKDNEKVIDAQVVSDDEASSSPYEDAP